MRRRTPAHALLALVGVLLGLSAPAIGAAVETGGYGSYYNLSTNEISTFSAPKGAFFKGVDVSQSGSITYAMQDDLSPQGRHVITTYFDSGVCVTLSYSSYTIPTSPQIAPGTAAVVRLSDKVVIGSATVAISGNQIVLQFNPVLLASGHAAFAVSNYLPLSDEISEVAGGFAACYVDSLDLYNPDADDILSPGGLQSSARRYEIHCRLLLEAGPTRIPIGMPSAGPEYGCPPLGFYAPTIPKTHDVNGDGTPEWKYPVNVRVPGGPLIVAVCGLDLLPTGPSGSDEYAIVIGHDDNGNGTLDPSEIDRIIGRCPFPRGRNKWRLEEHSDGKWYVHCISRWPREAGGAQAGTMRQYVYDPSTNTIKVYEIDKNGNLVDLNGNDPGQTWVGTPEACPYLQQISDAPNFLLEVTK